MTFPALALLAAVTVGTWNGQWFPSGRAEHRDTPENEARTIRTAGEMLRKGLDKADPSGTNDLILCFNEIRNLEAAEALVAAIGRKDLKVAVISAYRRRDRFDQQQDVVATTLPVAEASWSRWRSAGPNTPPRGFAFARVVLPGPVTTAVYSVHLKSDYGATTEAEAATNRTKRAIAVGQLFVNEKARRGKYASPVIIAGDFNADRWDEGFAKETIFDAFDKNGFLDVLSLLPPEDRWTHPGRGKWPNTALDHIELRGLSAEGFPVIVPAGGLSDHYPVFVTLKPAF